jgi:DNA uptake protein ComE-like DNA-binding protein
MIKRKLAGFALVIALTACADATQEEEQAVDTATTAETAAPTPAPAENSSGMLDPNTASAEQLATIPGLNQTLATELVNGRPYADMRAVDQKLASLSEEQRDTVYTRLWKPIDLNSATKEEIELIPGVGPRMRHEFEEYRPYTSMEQFRREIGKYVDAQEVARLEKFVMIPAGAQ